MSERIRPRDVAHITSLSQRKVQELAAAGKLPAMKADDGWTFDEGEIRAWVAAAERANWRRGSALRKQEAAQKIAAKTAKIEAAAERLIDVSVILANATTRAPRIVGVYFLIRRGSIVYVGRAIDVQFRIMSHIRSDVRFDAYSVVECKKRELVALERAYINALMPPLNRDPITMRMRRA